MTAATRTSAIATESIMTSGDGQQCQTAFWAGRQSAMRRLIVWHDGRCSAPEIVLKAHFREPAPGRHAQSLFRQDPDASEDTMPGEAERSERWISLDDDEGGETACWAHLVDEETGTISGA